MKTYKIEGIVLTRRNWGEADKLITIFTKQYGKKTVIAKGVRRISSRRAPYLEPFMQVQMVLHHGKMFDYVSEVTSVANFGNIRINLIKVSYTYIALEILNRLLADNQESYPIYKELINFLTDLNHQQTDKQMDEMLTRFKRFILVELGFISIHITLNKTQLEDKITTIIESHLKSPKLLSSLV